MEKIEAYKASDGMIFGTVEECQLHEVSLLWRERIEEFIESVYCDYKTGAHRGIAHKLIVGWERFKTEKGGTDGINK